jgi:hypothetical protein
MSNNFKNFQNREPYGFMNNAIECHNGIFQAIYFMDNLSGSLLLSKNFTIKTRAAKDEDLIGNFLNALNLFIKEIRPDDQNDEVQEINFKKTRILYENVDRLTIIAITNKYNINLERKILNKILTDFYNRYKEKIGQFNGLIDPSILSYKKILERFDYTNGF